MIEYLELEGKDVDSLSALRSKVMASDPYSFSVSPSEEKQANKSHLEKYLNQNQRSSVSMVLGAWDTALIGVIGIECFTGEVVSHKARIWGPYVREDYREQGIGKTLLGKLLDFARESETTEIVTLEASTASNKAINLFIRSGFQEAGQETKALKFGSLYYDVLRMQISV